MDFPFLDFPISGNKKWESNQNQNTKHSDPSVNDVKVMILVVLVFRLRWLVMVYQHRKTLVYNRTFLLVETVYYTGSFL